MLRSISRPAPKLAPSPSEVWAIRLRTLTPLFGGSATPREVDPANPIRAASVRGHLRFWWRAVAGGQYPTPQELFRAEEAIWGSTEKYGKVALRVLEQKVGQMVKPSDLVPDKGTARTGPQERYFLHPFNPNKAERLPEASGLGWVEFTLELSFSHFSEDQQEGLRRALRAWLAFGGIGARTRRGLGALEVTQNAQDWLPANPHQLRAWFAQPSVKKPEHTTLAGAVVRLGQPHIPNNADPYKGHKAWRELGRFWARFRKGHFVLDETGMPMTYMPMAGGKWHDHQTLWALDPHQKQIALAKPYLGLPIVYQCIGNSFSGTLEALHPQGRRMASPVILKPMAFADGSIRAAVVVLRTPAPLSIQIGKQGLGLQLPVQDPVLDALQAQDVLEAVLRAAHIQGFTEEVRL